MSSDARRKERKRLKREKKKADLRRAMSVSPYKRIGQAGELEACYINANWKENGLASVQVVRHNPAGGYAVACFLIDIWCAGLKDVTGRLDLMREDVEFNLKRSRESFELARIDLESARNLIAGAIRFARNNGFRLPAHFDRWTNFLGGVGDVANADLSSFGKNGKLQWVGHIDDLRARLIGCTVEEFFARSDVEFIADTDQEGFFDAGEEEDEIDEDSEEFEELVADMIDNFDRAADNLSGHILQKIIGQGRLAPAMLRQAVRFLFAGYIFRDYKNHPDQCKGPLLQTITAAAAAILLEFVSEDQKVNISPELQSVINDVAPILHEVSEEMIDEITNMLYQPDESSAHPTDLA
jgi:hypothetical protein